jgi:hypothetical protein
MGRCQPTILEIWAFLKWHLSFAKNIYGHNLPQIYFINNFTTMVFKILGDDMWKKEPLKTWGLSMLRFQVWWDHIGINLGSILCLVRLQSESDRNICFYQLFIFPKNSLFWRPTCVECIITLKKFDNGWKWS